MTSGARPVLAPSATPAELSAKVPTVETPSREPIIPAHWARFPRFPLFGSFGAALLEVFVLWLCAPETAWRFLCFFGCAPEGVFYTWQVLGLFLGVPQRAFASWRVEVCVVQRVFTLGKLFGPLRKYLLCIGFQCSLYFGHVWCQETAR